MLALVILLPLMLSLPLITQAPATAAGVPSAQSDGEPYELGGSIQAPVRIATPYPQYTKEALEQAVEGVVVLSVWVERDGTLSHVRVQQGLGHGLDEAAVAAVQRWRYHPATKDGVPVVVHALVKVNFKIEDGL